MRYSWMLVAAAVSLSGCAAFTTPPPPPVTLHSMQADYDQAEIQTEATEDALNKLRTSAREDLPQAYDTFKKGVERMEQIGARLVAHADGMYFGGAQYFSEVEKTGAACEFPRLKTGRYTQPAELGPFFTEISDESWQAKQAFRAYQFDLRQLKEYLGTSLTPRDIDSMRVLFRKAEADSISLEDALERAMNAIDRAKEARALARKPG